MINHIYRLLTPAFVGIVSLVQAVFLVLWLTQVLHWRIIEVFIPLLGSVLLIVVAILADRSHPES